MSGNGKDINGFRKCPLYQKVPQFIGRTDERLSDLEGEMDKQRTADKELSTAISSLDRRLVKIGTGIVIAAFLLAPAISALLNFLVRRNLQ